MTLTELESLSTLLRDETSSGAITATRLGNILLGIKSIFVTEESTHTDLQTQINTKASTTSLNAETSARQSADTAEANARAAADNTLQGNIDTEITNRGTAEAELLKRAQGRSLNFSTDNDPIFFLGDYCQGTTFKTYTEAVKAFNGDLDKMRRNSSEAFTFTDYFGNVREIPLGIVIANIDGVHIMMFNQVIDYNNDAWTQTIFTANIDGGYIVAGDDVYQRKHTASGWGAWAKIHASATEVANKVDKVAGKGLSTNDYDDTEKAKVAQVGNKQNEATITSEIWGNSGPADNTTYNLGEQSSLVLSTNGGTYSKCPNGTLIFFSCPTDAATSITYKDNTLWTGEDAPEVYAGCSYCIAIMNGAYSLQQLTEQSM